MNICKFDFREQFIHLVEWLGIRIFIWFFYSFLKRDNLLIFLFLDFWLSNDRNFRFCHYLSLLAGTNFDTRAFIVLLRRNKIFLLLGLFLNLFKLILQLFCKNKFVWWSFQEILGIFLFDKIWLDLLFLLVIFNIISIFVL